MEKQTLEKREPYWDLIDKKAEEKCTMNYCDEYGCQNRKRELVELELKEEPNNLTSIEEAAEKYTEFWLQNKGLLIVDAFNAGAKWQQEQDKNKFSEEEVIRILDKREDYLGTEPSIFDYLTNKEWFENFKKK